MQGSLKARHIFLKLHQCLDGFFLELLIVSAPDLDNVGCRVDNEIEVGVQSFAGPVHFRNGTSQRQTRLATKT